jgi:hypothetical protein
MAQQFEVGEPKVPEVDAAAGDGDERGSMYSSCGSLSFVITDDGDIEKIPEPVSTTADTVLNSYMTQSQYAQVMPKGFLGPALVTLETFFIDYTDVLRNDVSTKYG